MTDEAAMDATRIETFLKTRAKIRQLQILTAIGQTRNVMKAADALNMTQPAISRCVAQFETMLDTRLFERLPRGMVPTAEGEVLIEAATTILSEIRRLGTELSEMKSGDVGRLVIGFLPIGSSGPVPQAVAQLVKERPKLEITLVEGLYKDLVPMLRSGELDILFGRLHDSAHLAGLNHEIVYHQSWCLFGRSKHPLMAGGPRNLRDLHAESWILPVRESPARTLVNGFFRKNGLEQPGKAIECSSLMMARSIMMETDRIMFLPRGAWGVSMNGSDLSELPVRIGDSNEPVGLLTTAARRLRPVEKAFRALLLEAATNWASRV